MKKIFVGGQPPHATPKLILEALWQKLDIYDKKILISDTKVKVKNGYGFIYLSIALYTSHGNDLENTSLSLENGKYEVFLRPALSHRKARTKVLGDTNKKLFIHNLKTSIKDRNLEEYFKKFGEVEKAYSVFRQDDIIKGIGFVQFKNSQDAGKALMQETHFISGQRIYLKKNLLKVESNTTLNNRNYNIQQNPDCKENNGCMNAEELNFSLKMCKSNSYSNFGNFNKEFWTDLFLSKSLEAETSLRCNFEIMNLNAYNTHVCKEEICTNERKMILENTTNNVSDENREFIQKNINFTDVSSYCQPFYFEKRSVQTRNISGKAYSLF